MPPKATFQAERVFYRSEVLDPIALQVGIAGWYFQVRGGGEFGPYRDRPSANEALLEYVRECIRRKDDGGRNPKPAAPARQQQNGW